MRQLYYTLQTLIRGKGSNLIKIISLGLGLAVSILIFSRQAFELNYDTCYKDHERLCLVKTVWYYNNEYHPSHITLGPVAGTIAENLPDEVESVTVTQQWWSNSAWFANERRFQTNAMTADSCFFATMGIDVVSGDPRELNNPEVVFISRELAGSMFADKNPIGQTVVYNKQMSMTVKGIFEDFPENSSFYGSGVVMSLATSFKHHWGYWGWGGGDSYMSFVRLRPGVQLDDVNTRIEKLAEQVRKSDDVFISLVPIKDYRMEFGISTMRMVWILLTLGTAILFIVAMNYVLISISAMNRRAKAIGVHKCSGANTGTIFGMFLWETGVIMLSSLLLVALLLFNFREPLEDMLDVSLAGLFSSFQKVIDDQNSTVTDFRNAALLAAITILFVTLMGLIGYINDEIQRRSKEIAIRKVNGAEASSILRLFSKDIFWISLPAVFLGGLGAWYIGGVWIEQFVEGVDFGICGFLLIACIVLLFIIGCVVFKAWRIANENPVDSIKSE